MGGVEHLIFSIFGIRGTVTRQIFEKTRCIERCDDVWNILKSDEMTRTRVETKNLGCCKLDRRSYGLVCTHTSVDGDQGFGVVEWIGRSIYMIRTGEKSAASVGNLKKKRSNFLRKTAIRQENTDGIFSVGRI